MTISTRAELAAAILSWTVRPDFSTRMNDVISMVEADIRKDVRCLAMETLASGTLTGETLAHPTRFIAARRLKVGDYVLDYRTPAQYQDFQTAGSVQPVYTILGQSFYILNGASGDAYSLLYWAAFAPMTETSDTNWLLQEHPDVYLYGGCAKVAEITRNKAGDFERWTALYQTAVAKVSAEARAAAVSGHSLAMRSVSVE